MNTEQISQALMCSQWLGDIYNTAREQIMRTYEAPRLKRLQRMKRTDPSKYCREELKLFLRAIAFADKRCKERGLDQLEDLSGTIRIKCLPYDCELCPPERSCEL